MLSCVNYKDLNELNHTDTRTDTLVSVRVCVWRKCGGLRTSIYCTSNSVKNGLESSRLTARATSGRNRGAAVVEADTVGEQQLIFEAAGRNRAAQADAIGRNRGPAAEADASGGKWRTAALHMHVGERGGSSWASEATCVQFPDSNGVSTQCPIPSGD